LVLSRGALPAVAAVVAPAATAGAVRRSHRRHHRALSASHRESVAGRAIRIVCGGNTGHRSRPITAFYLGGADAEIGADFLFAERSPHVRSL